MEHTIQTLTRTLDIKPTLLAHDLHPNYLSTQYAMEHQGVFDHIVAVQHHHAHIVSCMAEHGVEDEVIGLAMDGTGYGLDGTVWGGEILRATTSSFERLGHFNAVEMVGGEKAVREPYRMALSYYTMHSERIV